MHQSTSFPRVCIEPQVRSAITRHTVTQRRKLLRSVLKAPEFDPLTENKSAVSITMWKFHMKNDESERRCRKMIPKPQQSHFLFEETTFSAGLFEEGIRMDTGTVPLCVR